MIPTMSSNPSFSAPCPSNSHPIHRLSCYHLTIAQSSMSSWQWSITRADRAKYVWQIVRQSPMQIGWWDAPLTLRDSAGAIHFAIDDGDFNKLCRSRSFFRYPSKYDRLSINEASGISESLSKNVLLLNYTYAEMLLKKRHIWILNTYSKCVYEIRYISRFFNKFWVLQVL